MDNFSYIAGRSFGKSALVYAQFVLWFLENRKNVSNYFPHSIVVKLYVVARRTDASSRLRNNRA